MRIQNEHVEMIQVAYIGGGSRMDGRVLFKDLAREKSMSGIIDSL